MMIIVVTNMYPTADAPASVLRDEQLGAEVAARAVAVYDEVRWEKTSRTYLEVVRGLVDENSRRAA